jgi:catechol 2,3-dioxygenase-like lactoylglutathione lyase family enzyme
MLSMPSGIDHLVIAVADPDAAAAELTEVLGLAFTAGGRHAGLGTFNRIAFLGDAYLELMGVDDRDAAKGWPIGAAAVDALDSDGGFATWALADEAIQVTVRRLQANGSSIGGVTRGSRERPDGELVEWWSAMPPQLAPDLPPFLIKHLEAGAEWGAEALAERRAFLHPIGGPVTLLGIQLAVADPVRLAAACGVQVGLEFQSIGSAAVASVGRQTIRLVTVPSPGVALSVRLGVGGWVQPGRSVHTLGVEFVTISASAA